MSKFGILGNITILQSAVSSFISKLNPAVIHNVGKYMAIKKAFYLSAIEQTKGDYYEFGVYTGSSFTHAIKCAKSNEKFDPGLTNMKFYGFDSFQGFGKLSESEKHSFYTDVNFKTDYKKVFKRVNRILPSNRFELVDGFFEETLQSNPKSNLAKIIFIDSDTYSSARLALNYLRPTMQKGTIIILDDYFSYKGSIAEGVCGAFKKFIYDYSITTRTIFNYGMGGVVIIII
jgi:O-methyltransferase